MRSSRNRTQTGFQGMNVRAIILIIATCIGILLACDDDKHLNDVPPPGKDTTKINGDEKFPRHPEFFYPEQVKPSKIIVCNVNFGNRDEAMLAESVAGLAAQAVNERKYDALVWINVTGWSGDVRTSFDKWLDMAKSRLNIVDVETMDIWSVIDQMRERGLIKGYILYEEDVSEGNPYKPRPGLNHSANFATTAAGAMKGIMISEELESTAASHDLKRLLDVRNETYASIYGRFKESLNPNMGMHIDPKYPNHRGMGVAFNSFVFYGDQYYHQFMRVLNPASPVLGWGYQNEIIYTTALSNYGLVNAASNYCDNLLVSSAGARSYQHAKVKTLDPKTIDFSAAGSFYSFIMSDGDNLQWMQRGFFVDEKYWANPAHGDFPMGWTSSLSAMSELLPDALDYMAATQPAHTSVIEAEGGYHYPDEFGLLTPDRKEALREFAKKLNAHMKKTGARILELICKDIDSQAARDAYQIYAEEIENLIGIVVLEFSTGYEGGNGEIFWPTNKEGVHIPVVSSKFSLWDGLSDAYSRSGGPTKLAAIINADADAAKQSGTQSMEWAVVMAWSQSTQNGFTAQGLTPVAWCVEKLDANVNVVSPEELLWRIRMKHYPDETSAAINR